MYKSVRCPGDNRDPNAIADPRTWVTEFGRKIRGGGWERR